jgi:hypothetical protein
MSSHCKQGVFFVLMVCAFLATSQTTRACSCGPKPTVLDSYDGSDVVIIARVVSVETVAANEIQEYVDGVRSATLRVEKVFKGDVNVRDELVFGQGGGADCIWTFNEESIGDEVLLYLDRPEKISDRSFLPSQDPKLWFAGGCGRSRGVEGATDDLLYLEKMSKVRGKTRISGTIGGWQNPNINVDGKKIHIIGEKKTYLTKTDRHGVFEIYDLPPGKYFVEPEMPSGWKIDPFWTESSPSLSDRYQAGERGSSKRVEIVLQPKKHAGVDIVFATDNLVRGKVLGPDGKPLENVCVYLWGREQLEGFGPFNCTNENGNFEITSVSSGEYVAVVNRDGRLSNREPFKTLYYPNVSEREKAAIITVSPGDSISDINIVVPSLIETVTLEGVLLYSDGKPAVEESVRFEAGSTEGINGDVTERTDSAGRFSLKILKGLSGELSGEDWVYVGLLENCPKVDELLVKSGRNNLTIQSNVLKLKTDQNFYDLELRLPFPHCENAKE